MQQEVSEKEKDSQQPDDQKFDMGESAGESFGIIKWAGFIGGLALFLLMLFSSTPQGLSLAGWRTAAVAVLMATWWVAEVIPISGTALLPLVLFPVFGVADIETTAAPYADPMIYLFLGGFIIAIAMQRWDLHRRIALNIIGFIGTKPRNIIAGFIISSAFMSMWVSNTAATMMMLPIALSVIQLAKNADESGAVQPEYRNFALTLMLAIAYAANVGGLGTVIGTPTNALMIAFVNDAYAMEITFAQWMSVGIPLVLVGLPVIFYVLTNWVFPMRLQRLPGGKAYIEEEVNRLGKISRPEIMVAAVFVLTAMLWMSRPLLVQLIPGLSDAGIAIFGALLLFLIPVNLRKGIFLMRWRDVEELPWGVLILFGGGLTLAGAIQRTGLAEWVGGYFEVLGGWPVILSILVISMVIIMFTELASNSATAAAFLPVIGSVAIGIGQNPLLFAVPVTMVASCAFMLPVATPPNAIVYGSGVMTIPEMSKAGLALNLCFVILITLMTYFVFSAILGIRIGHVPALILP
ncbi:SLC13 family permease [Fodinibius sediminis]|uniref:Solute carrier family 13 (Sodium-dependent dicarboxylate transporter), member 2/3/5 n=1 Tax=Fodinibius sediminis TaxID=1214077 RepID=A0A521E4Y8_9BACT|nr:DASS family sodium-coupled anion symporter [Fodinibius sediminis]SMO79003.1 solute carrier family 13 (sodium-dependent dicarboxylate transporter), member 2/3/5 [Fodinibius sediminis]